MVGVRYRIEVLADRTGAERRKRPGQRRRRDVASPAEPGRPMSYVDAGYATGLSVLFLYAVGLVIRRRSLERAVELSSPPSDSAERETGAASGP